MLNLLIVVSIAILVVDCATPNCYLQANCTTCMETNGKDISYNNCEGCAYCSSETASGCFPSSLTSSCTGQINNCGKLVRFPIVTYHILTNDSCTTNSIRTNINWM